MRNAAVEREREREREREYVPETYESVFYRRTCRGKFKGTIKGFPLTKGSWCKHLKEQNLRDIRGFILSHTFEENEERREDRSNSGFCEQLASSLQEPEERFFFESPARGAQKNIVQYLGIAADEPLRIQRHTKPGVVLPLVEIGWDEAYCRKWCEENNLLSPIYTTATRGGCWFCHNQGVEQLRLLRKNYPDLWALLLKWDEDSPATFKSDGHTVHDFDKRFAFEDAGLLTLDKPFRWKTVQLLEEQERTGDLLNATE